MTTSYEQAVARGETMRPMFPEYDGDPLMREALAVFLDRYMEKLSSRERELLRAVALERLPLKDAVEPGGVRGYLGMNPRTMSQRVRTARRAFLRAAAKDDPRGAPRADASETVLIDAAARVLEGIKEGIRLSRRPTEPHDHSAGRPDS